MSSIIRNESLAPSGNLKIDWVYKHMPICAMIEERFIKKKPFEGLNITTSIHLEAKTARTALLLKAGGAKVYATGSNPLSTQDDVAAGLMSRGVNVFGWYGATEKEYKEHLLAALSCKPDLIIDDGGDLTQILCDERPDLTVNLKGGSEETTTGVLRLKARAEKGELPFPMVCVNDAQMKFMFDNRYGTGQSVWTAIMSATNLVVAGKNVVVAGYGWCGKGVSMRAKGMGARVIVTEVDPIKAVEALMDGFEVMTMADAAPLGDIFITVTGCKDVVRMEHILTMKQGAILCNAGHFDVEVAVAEMKKNALSIGKARNNIEKYTFVGGKYVYLLAEGRLVNLAAGDGHPAEIMDISFALQALSAEYLAKNADNLAKTVQEVPKDIDIGVARMKIASMGMSIDTLSPQQYEYIHSAN
ncbi:MAG: adenosylhomocysteinase [Eubacteriaceae bacterium]|nr:adenosylhomocysteinase [Eubacteriaceae bacterium]